MARSSANPWSENPGSHMEPEKPCRYRSTGSKQTAQSAPDRGHLCFTPSLAFVRMTAGSPTVGDNAHVLIPFHH
eukprot:1034336-Pyramimonas_sp.AAC.1